MITEVFQDRLQDIQDACTATGAGLRGQQQQRWMFTTGDGAPSREDPAGVHAFFSRDAIDKIYLGILRGETEGDRAEMGQAKLQGDFLSGFERDYQMRCRGRIRMLAHEVTARAHAGGAGGSVAANILRFLHERDIKADLYRGKR